MAIKHRDRAEPFGQSEGLRTIRGAPAPIGINRPQRNMREHHDRPAGGLGLQIGLEPRKLLLAELAQALDRLYVGEPDKMDVLVVEAVPELAIALLVYLAVVHRSI